MFENQTDNVKKNMDNAVENMQNLLNLTMTNLDKLTDINLNYTKQALDKSTQTLTSLTQTKDYQDFWKVFNCLMEELSENNWKCMREYCEVSDKSKDTVSELWNPLFNNPYSLGLKFNNSFFSNKYIFPNLLESMESKYKEMHSTFYKLMTDSNASWSNAKETLEGVAKVMKEAATRTYETSQKVATENVNTAKMVATEAVSAVLNSAKSVAGNVSDAAKKASLKK